MSNGIQTIQTANNGLTAITSLVQQLQATVSQARSNSSAATVTPGTATTLSTTGNSSDTTNNKLTFHVANGISVDINTDGITAATLTGTTTAAATATGDITIQAADLQSGAATTVTITAADTLATVATNINTAMGATIASVDSTGHLVLNNASGNNITVTDTNAGTAADIGLVSGYTSTNGVVGTPLTVDQIVSKVNGNTSLNAQITASKDSTTGALVLQNKTSSAITVDGITSAAVTGDATDTLTIAAGAGGGLSTVRQSLLAQFNSLLTQVDKTATNSGYNGVNLLNGDTLKLNFNENGTSSIDIQTKDANGASFAINSTNLNLTAQLSTDFANNTTLNSLSATLTTSLTTLRTQASALGSSLSVVQTRQDFTKSMINTLQTGADNLVLADTNQEGANLLALQTRQSLSTTALSLSAQADQAVLSLFQ